MEQLTTDHRLRLSGGLEQLSSAVGINPNLEIGYRLETLERGDDLKALRLGFGAPRNCKIKPIGQKPQEL